MKKIKPSTEDFYKEILQVLQELKKKYPEYNMGRHIATILDDFGDIWGAPDKELLFSLTKYKAQLEMDVPHIEDKDIESIIEDGMNLSMTQEDEDEFDEQQRY